ncbi:MAG: hypothetical protein K1X44_07485 [Alphaproteobacteria bacterium]|nr:hypothetical protein [Alphaproteobacteria bacterium]
MQVTENIPQDQGMIQSPPNNQKNNWVDHLDELAKNMVHKKGYKTPNDLAKAYLHAEKLLGGEKISLPGKNANAQDWDYVWQRLGRPENIEGYQFNVPSDFPLYDQDFAKWYKEKAYQAGLTKKQASLLHDAFVDYTIHSQNNHKITEQIKRQELEETLHQEWNKDYDVNLQIARQAAKIFVDDQGVLDMLENTLGGPAMVKFFYKIGQTMQEDFLKGPKGSLSKSYSPQMAEAEITRLKGDPDFNRKWMDKYHPEHQQTIQQMTELHRLAHNHPLDIK